MSTTISGRVSVQGETSLDATVELHNSTGDIVTQSQVDEEGRYIFHLAPGRWAVNGYDTKGHRGRGDFELEDGDHKVLDLDLTEG